MIARVGGAALAGSVLLPWFALSVEQLASMGFSLWDLERNAAILLVVVGLLCALQPKLGSDDSSAMAYLALGGLMTAAIVYKVFVSPPGSEYMNGLAVEGVSLKEMLSAIGIEFKPAIGAYVGVAGAAAIALGGLIQVRAGGTKAALGMSVEEQAAYAALRPQTQMQPAQLAPGQQRYVAPQTAAVQARPAGYVAQPQRGYVPQGYPEQAAQPQQQYAMQPVATEFGTHPPQPTQ